MALGLDMGRVGLGFRGYSPTQLGFRLAYVRTPRPNPTTTGKTVSPIGKTVNPQQLRATFRFQLVLWPVTSMLTVI